MRRLAATSMLFLGLLAVPAQGKTFIDFTDQELIQLGERAEREGQPMQAIEAYSDLVVMHPSSPYERRASARLDWLKARGEGELVPLATFLKVRNKRDVTRDELLAFWRDAEKFPSGLVKRESMAFTAEALAGRMNDPAAALPIYEAWLREPGISQAERELAASGAALSHWKLGNVSAGVELLRSLELTNRPEWRFLRVQAFRQVAHPIALGCVALFGALVLMVLARGWRQLRWRELIAPKPWLMAAYVISIPCLLAVRFENALKHDYQELALKLGITLGVAIIASLAARAVGSKLRAALAVSAFLCCLSVGLLVMEETEMLEGFMRWYGV